MHQIVKSCVSQKLLAQTLKAHSCQANRMKHKKESKIEQQEREAAGEHWYSMLAEHRHILK